MELPWNLCPFCGTPTPGKRRENLSMSEALESLSRISPEETDSTLDLDFDLDLDLEDGRSFGSTEDTEEVELGLTEEEEKEE
jgi:hypothetical protein